MIITLILLIAHLIKTFSSAFSYHIFLILLLASYAQRSVNAEVQTFVVVRVIENATRTVSDFIKFSDSASSGTKSLLAVI
jgi:hypothetical protein